jgi:hypothetical protein
MKLSIASLTILCLTLAAVTASAQQIPQQVLYNNGQANGCCDAWPINLGSVTSDTFTLASASTVSGFDFYTWEFPGDQVLTVDWSITSGEFGGTSYGSGTASLIDKFLSSNAYGYNVDKVTASGLNVALNAATYWLNLQNAVTKEGNTVYWDENSGVGCRGDDGKGGGCPSKASESAVGTIPSEPFDILGNGTGTTPEPGGIILLVSGIGLAGALRNRVRKSN